MRVPALLVFARWFYGGGPDRSGMTAVVDEDPGVGDEGKGAKEARLQTFKG